MKDLKEYSDIELIMELDRRRRAESKPGDRERTYPKVESAYVKDGRVEIRMSDGRSVSVCLDGYYNPNRIKVLYHSHEWDWFQCTFDNYGYPE